MTLPQACSVQPVLVTTWEHPSVVGDAVQLPTSPGTTHGEGRVSDLREVHQAEDTGCPACPGSTRQALEPRLSQ